MEGGFAQDAPVGGALVEVRLRRHPFAVAFAAMWFGFLGAMLALVISGWAAGVGTFAARPVVIVFMLVWFGAVGAGAMWLMRLMARPQEKTLHAFIARILEAGDSGESGAAGR